MSNQVIKNTSEDSENLFTTSDEPPSTKLKNFMEISKRFNATIEQWNDWKWQISNCIKSYAELSKIYPDFKHDEENDIPFKMSITPYYLTICSNWPHSRAAKMFLPHKDELLEGPSGCSLDPLDEEHQMGVKNLVHRYPDRALIITTTFCSQYCRYCIRKRSVGYSNESLTTENLNEITDYLISHPEIKDCIISGGDFLTLDNKKIKQILDAIDSVESVEIIRIGTKIPVVLPQRLLDRELIGILQNVKKPLYINTHFNVPEEVTVFSSNACLKIASLGIPLGNQSVLLKGVNNDLNTMIELNRALLKIKCRPYYLFQCDQISGTEGFRTDIREGIEIIDQMRGKISGLGIPKLILDSKFGKIEITKNRTKYSDDEKMILINNMNQEITYWN